MSLELGYVLVIAGGIAGLGSVAKELTTPQDRWYLGIALSAFLLSAGGAVFMLS
jgi:hypothetical protein